MGKFRNLFTNPNFSEITERLDRQAKRISGAEKKSQLAAKDAELHVRELNRIAPQIVALEERLENLRQSIAKTPPIQEPADIETARTYLDEIRKEHQLIRLRLTAVATYEERLRRIEVQLGLPHD